MKAMVIVPGDRGGKLELRNIPEPVAGPGELLIRVKATALNRADLAQLQGNYPTPATGGESQWSVGGLEAAGEVAAMGSDVAGFALGDRVMAMCGGGYSEYVCIDHRLALHQSVSVGRRPPPFRYRT